MCGAADDKLLHIELVVFRLTEGRLELLIISVHLFWVLHCVKHISWHHSWKVGVTVNYTQTVFMLIQKKKKILFNIFTCYLSYAVLQIGRSLVRSQLVSLEFFIDIKSFQSHYGPGVDSASNRNEYQEHFLGVKAAGA